MGALGEQAAGLSVISRLKAVGRGVTGPSPRSVQERWVYIGVNKRGEKRFLAVEDDVRESTDARASSRTHLAIPLKVKGPKGPRS